MTSAIPPSSIRVLLPVKPFSRAKSRLDVPAGQRPLVARRLFVHTLDVALRCLQREQVFVMTADLQVRGMARSRQVRTIDDAADDLNGSLDAALLALRRRFPSDTLAVMVADLPRLVAPVLTSVLRDAASSDRPRHVVDHHRSGTTFVSLPPSSALRMVFGPDSARRFARAGSVPMLLPPPAMTHDLDVRSDLDALDAQLKEILCPSTPS